MGAGGAGCHTARVTVMVRSAREVLVVNFLPVSKLTRAQVLRTLPARDKGKVAFCPTRIVQSVPRTFALGFCVIVFIVWLRFPEVYSIDCVALVSGIIIIFALNNLK